MGLQEWIPRDGEGPREKEDYRRDREAPSEGWRNSSNEVPRFGTRFWNSGGPMVTRKLRNDEAQVDEVGIDPEEGGSDSAGQSGDAQGLSQIADADEESVRELAETDQTYEAEEGVEDAGDHATPVR